MELNEVIGHRSMTRHFEPTPIEPSQLQAVLAAALRAPSAGFSQGVDLLVLTDEARRRRFWDLASEPSWRASPPAKGLLVAPVIVLPLSDPQAYADRYSEADKAESLLFNKQPNEWPVPYWLVDTAFATMLLLLAAAEAGLGALFFQLHGEDRAILDGIGAPADRSLIGALALGHRAAKDPRTSPSRRARREFEEVVHFENW